MTAVAAAAMGLVGVVDGEKLDVCVMEVGDGVMMDVLNMFVEDGVIMEVAAVAGANAAAATWSANAVSVVCGEILLMLN